MTTHGKRAVVVGGGVIGAASAYYLVRLKDAPAATYMGGVPGYAATSARARGETVLDVQAAATYAAYLDERQSAAPEPKPYQVASYAPTRDDTAATEPFNFILIHAPWQGYDFVRNRAETSTSHEPSR